MAEAVMPSVFGVGNPGSEKETAGFEVQTAGADESEFEQHSDIAKTPEEIALPEEASIAETFLNESRRSLDAELDELNAAVKKKYKIGEEKSFGQEAIDRTKEFLSRIGDIKIHRRVTLGGLANFVLGYAAGREGSMIGRKFLISSGASGVVAAIAVGGAFGAVRAGLAKNREATEAHFGAKAWQTELEAHKDNPAEQMAIIKGLLTDPDYQKKFKAGSEEALALVGKYQETALALEEAQLNEAISKQGESTALAEYLKTASAEKRREVLRAAGWGAVKGAIIGLAGYGVGQLLGGLLHGTPAEAQGTGGHEQAAVGPPGPLHAPVGNTHVLSPEAGVHHAINWRMEGDHPRLAINANGHFDEGGNMRSVVDIEHGGNNHDIAHVISTNVTHSGAGTEGGHFENMSDTAKLKFEQDIENYLKIHPDAIQSHVANIPASELNHALDAAQVHLDPSQFGTDVNARADNTGGPAVTTPSPAPNSQGEMPPSPSERLADTESANRNKIPGPGIVALLAIACIAYKGARIGISKINERIKNIRADEEYFKSGGEFDQKKVNGDRAFFYHNNEFVEIVGKSMEPRRRGVVGALTDRHKPVEVRTPDGRSIDSIISRSDLKDIKYSPTPPPLGATPDNFPPNPPAAPAPTPPAAPLPASPPPPPPAQPAPPSTPQPAAPPAPVGAIPPSAGKSASFDNIEDAFHDNEFGSEPEPKINETRKKQQAEVDNFGPQRFAGILAEENGLRGFLTKIEGKMRDKKVTIHLNPSSETINRTYLRDVTVESVDPNNGTIVVVGRNDRRIKLIEADLHDIDQISYELKGGENG